MFVRKICTFNVDEIDSSTLRCFEVKQAKNQKKILYNAILSLLVMEYLLFRQPEENNHKKTLSRIFFSFLIA